MTVVPASFVLADGIYINSSNGTSCINISSSTDLSEYTDGATSQTRFCQPRDVSTQVNRTLFYGAIGGDPTANAINLMVGGTAYINSGSLGIGGGQDDTEAQGSIRMGGGVAAHTSLDNYGQRREPSGTLGGSSGMYAIAIGGGESDYEATLASADYATAVGYNSRALGESSLALGNTANASGESSLALGNKADALAAGALAFGEGATVATDAASAMAIGSGANTTLENSVALGAGSKTISSEKEYSYLTKQVVSKNNVVSVGSESLKRRIQNLADGAEDSDAVTVAQLKQVGKVADGGGFGLTAADGKNIEKDLGESIAVVGADSNISTKVNTSNNELEIELSKDLAGLNSVEVVDATDPTKKTMTTAGGTVVTDGTNTSTLAAIGTTVTDGTNKSVYGANGVNINEGSVILNDAGLNVGGIKVSKNGIDANNTTISNVANATSKDQAVNLGQLQELSTAGTTGGFGLTTEGGEVKQDLGKSIAVVGADSNISTKVNNDQVEIELNKELTGLTSIETVDASDPTKKTTTTASGTVVTDGTNTSTLAATGTTVTDGTNSSIYGVNGVNIHNGTVVLDHTGLNVGGVTVSKNGINANGTQISNVANATSNDQAVNLGQLNDRLENLTTGGIQYDDEATKDKVTLGGHGGTTITNVKDGEIAKGSSDAVNGGQIYDLENNLQNQITNNSNDIFDLQNQINNIDAGNNLVQQETPTSEVTIAGKTGGNSVNVAGTDGDRKVTGVANGQISANSVDAVNGSQLQTNYDNVAAGLGGGAKYENGTWTGPEYTVGETTVTNVGDAIDALNKSDQQLDSQLTSLSNKVDNMYITTNERIDRLEKDTNSGIASAIAIASLPQPTEKGYTMMSAGTGVWKGEAGLAIGASGVTEDRVLFKKPVNYIWKFASTVDTRSNWGGGASVGVQWK